MTKTKTETENTDDAGDGFLRCYVTSPISQEGERYEIGSIVEMTAPAFMRLSRAGACCLLSEHEANHAAECAIEAVRKGALASVAKAKAKAAKDAVIAKANAVIEASRSKDPARKARATADKAAHEANHAALKAKADAQAAEELAGTRMRPAGTWTPPEALDGGA